MSHHADPSTAPGPIPPEGVQEIVRDAYGLDARAKRLVGEVDLNFLVTAGEQRLVFKVVSPETTDAHLDLQRAALNHVAMAEVPCGTPRFLPAKDGRFIVPCPMPDGSVRRAYALTFLDGTLWTELEAPSPALLNHLGYCLGALDAALEHFEHPAAIREDRWDLAQALSLRPLLRHVGPATRRQIGERLFQQVAACVRPHVDALPQQVIHNDANDHNLVVDPADPSRLVGLFDFNDLLHSYRVCEPAIAAAYAMLGSGDPLETTAEIAAGYHAANPLTDIELAVLFPLALARLASSAVIAAERRAEGHDAPYLYVTEGPAWELLEGPRSPVDIGPDEAEERLRAACGLPVGGGPNGPRSPHGPEDLLTERRRRIGPSLSVSYRQHLAIVRGRGQYLFDHRGRPYLDLVNNVCHVGHCHPRVVEAGQRQMAQLNTNTRYLYPGLTDYAERLASTLPEGLDVCYFVTSGSEANELALRLARAHTGRQDILVHEGAYHGHTSTLIDISPYKFLGSGGPGEAQPWVHMTPMPDGYRGSHRGDGPEVGQRYGAEVARTIEDAGRPIAAFIAEPILGCGGQVVPPEGYLDAAYGHVRAAGGLCIADEVQVGFGRVGSHFWTFETQGVVPDIVVLGKPIGNGHPMAAVVTTRAIAESFANGMEFFSTFGGNPVSCAIGMAVLDVVRDEGLQDRARELGQRLMDGFRELQGRHPLIGDVRGRGLFLGLELVRDPDTLEPADTEASELVERMRDQGILLSTDGPLHNVIKIKPPMVLDEGDVDGVLRVLDTVLANLSPRP